MRRVIALLALLLLLSGCGAREEAEASFTVACTTYPVYLLANTIAADVEGVAVELVVNQQVSCLHDYALTVSDMKVLERADVVAINGAGLEDFLGDALGDKPVIDCDEGIPLMNGEAHEEHEEQEEHHGHHHDGADPHIWMDPRNYARMALNLAEGLAERDPSHEDRYRQAGREAAEELTAFYERLRTSPAGERAAGLEIITFHDGFSYFAHAFDLHIAAAIEEEEGAEASARELKEIIAIVEAERLPAIFTEVNGSANAARIIQRECGVASYPLSMVMSGAEGDTIGAYEARIAENLNTIGEAYP